MKKWAWILVLVVLTMAFGVAGASAEMMNVSNAAELAAAMATININGGEYTISLQADIESYLSLTNPTATVTLVGNGHSLSAALTACSVSGGTLNLGDGQSELILIGSNTYDEPGLIHVFGKNAACNMYDKVTIKDNKSQNYLGGGVTVEQSGTFHMYGGTIRNCGVEGGSVCYGGGVAAYSGGKFIMDGGLIDGCYANTDYIDSDSSCITATGGGVFVSAGAIFEMNGGTIQNCTAKYGAGVALAMSYSEIEKYNAYGYIDSKVTINDGKIVNNKSELGGGVFASGMFYAYASALGTQSPGTGSNESTGLCVYGGEISGNDAYDGGGVFLWGVRNTASQNIQIYDTSVLDNTAVEGAGMYLGYYWTSAEIKDCIITGNEAMKDADGDGGTGGGIYVMGNSGNRMTGTTILCNNKAETQGADVYISGNISFNMTSASDMDQNFHSTRFVIDGWYDDTDPRWSEANADGTGNTYLGDTYVANGTKGIIAAYTPYDEIQIIKTWDDADNILGKRPDSLTISLTDSDGNPVKLRTYDAASGSWTTGDDEAKITLSSADADLSDANKWTGTIGPLLVDDYSDTEQYVIKEDDAGIFYVPDTTDPTLTFISDISGSEDKTKPGVFTAPVINVGRLPVTIVKIWDDVNNKDLIRPATLSTQLVIGTEAQSDMDGRNAFPLAEDPTTHAWSITVYLPAKDYSALQATEGTVDGYEQMNYNRAVAEDGTLSFVFVNKHTIAPAAANTVRNENMVSINYEAVKTWAGTNPAGDKKLPRPQVTVILTDDIGSPERTVVIPANADPATALFENLPKYKNNDGNVPITYTIREEITDPAWIKAGENLWYSLDGMGKYEGAITNVTAENVRNTDPLGTVTGAKATNTYSSLQTTTSVDVTKLWKDHQNENGVRPESITLGLFKNETDSTPVATVTLTGESTADQWSGSFVNLPIYDDSGAAINYSSYSIKESYDNGAKWISDGDSWTINKDGHTYTYDYSVVTDP